MITITILALGSRGDVEPYIALAKGLHTAGYNVNIGADEFFRDFILSHHINFKPINANFKQLFSCELGQRILADGINGFSPKFIISSVKLSEPLIEAMLEDCQKACKDADVIIAAPPVGLLAGYSIAEQTKKIFIPVFLYPFHSTRFFPCILSPAQNNLGKIVNKVTWSLFDIICRSFFIKPYNQWRNKELKLTPIKSIFQKSGISLYGISPHVMQKPSDWADTIYLTGYWILKQPIDWQPPSSLTNFLGSGPRPLCISFGSMILPHKEIIFDTIMQSLINTKQRAIIISGWTDFTLRQNSENIYITNNIPYDWLLEHIAGMVHHAGAGTVARVLTAGIPSISIPFMYDQPFWAHRLYQLAVAAKPIQFNKLTTNTLTNAISAITRDKNFQANAVNLKEKIKHEDGVANAVEIVNQYLNTLMHA